MGVASLATRVLPQSPQATETPASSHSVSRVVSLPASPTWDAGGTTSSLPLALRGTARPSPEPPPLVLAISQLLDGGVDRSWLSESFKLSWVAAGGQPDGSPGVPWVRPAPRPWPHDHLRLNFPIPSLVDAELIQNQLMATTPGDSAALQQGPSGRWLHSLCAWAAVMEDRFIPGTFVTGNWRRAAASWRSRMALLTDRGRAASVMRIITKGGRFKFNARPPVIRTFRNHPALRERKEAVWATLSEQLAGRSACPYDTKGALLQGSTLLLGRLPRGMSSIRWVLKKHTDKVRVTMNMSPFKPFFDPADVACDLETNLKLRHKVQEGDVFIGLDQRSSFFHYELDPRDRTYAGFSLHAADLPNGVAARLARQSPCAVLLLGSSKPIGLKRFGRGDFRLVFCMAGLPMGVSPAVHMLSFVMDALLDVWRLFPVGQGESLELPRATNYVDDSAFILSRTHARNGFELSARVVIEYILLGFRLNLPKCHLSPTPWLTHLGLLWDARVGPGCSFSLTKSRAANIAATFATLAKVVVVGQRVPLAMVAAVVGTIWSIHAVAHRAVAIMCRAMISVIAIALRVPELTFERDSNRLAVLLKRAWRGVGVWTLVAHAELAFWLCVDLRKLSSKMRYDASAARLRTWVARPDGTVSDNVRVWAVDTSDSGSGGAEFMRHGCLWALKPGTQMFIRLAPTEVATSSCMRELLGVLRLDLTSIPSTCSRAVVMCDSQAAVACLLRGSKIPQLQQVVRRIFLRQLATGRVLFPVWVRRSFSQIVSVDTISRTRLGCVYSAPPDLFSVANARALALWGRECDVDAFADMHNAMRRRDGWVLPFFSREHGPHTSGVDAFLQNWRGLVSWVNAPFALIGRVLALVRAQGVAAVVVVPLGRRDSWAQSIRLGATGVRAIWPYDPGSPVFRMRGLPASAPVYRGNYALAFLDFRFSNLSSWRGLAGRVSPDTGRSTHPYLSLPPCAPAQ